MRDRSELTKEQEAAEKREERLREEEAQLLDEKIYVFSNSELERIFSSFYIFSNFRKSFSDFVFLFFSGACD